jgi:3-hydroxyisobutyrate dehydrogenase
LTIMASSDDPADLEQRDAKAVLENVASKGSTLYPIPGGLGAGQSAKALNQVMCGIHIVSASEIMGIAAVLGLDTQKFYDTLVARDSSGKTIPGWTWMFENRGPRMLSATPPLASATAIINKDVGIIRDEEERVKVDLPLLNCASEVITKVMETHASADDSCIVQHYLGFGSDRQSLAVERVGRPSIDTTEQDSLINDVANANAVIHLVSAYETTRFAQALDLMGPQQKKQWFSIISGAAGASTIFSEVIPRALEDPQGIESGFQKYAQENFTGILPKTVSCFHYRFVPEHLLICHAGVNHRAGQISKLQADTSRSSRKEPEGFAWAVACIPE